jgi:hypothetical protein
MNKFALKFLIALLALSLAGCAAYFSVIGLAKLFAGAGIAVIVMASVLEASKLIIASFLHNHWSKINVWLRSYLVIAIVIIASITSIGIYGYLSGAYQLTKSKYDLSLTVTDSLGTQKSYYQSSATFYQNQLNSKNSQLTSLIEIRSQQDSRATQLVNQERSTYSADRSARETNKSIESITSEIAVLNDKVIAYSDSASKMQVAITKVKLESDISSELGSLSYVSKILNVSMDYIVNVLIILFMIVFDPLAISMVLAFNFLSVNKSIESNETFTESNLPDNTIVQPSETDLEPAEQVMSITEVIDLNQDEIRESDEEKSRRFKENARLKRIDEKRKRTQNNAGGAVKIY